MTTDPSSPAAAPAVPPAAPPSLALGTLRLASPFGWLARGWRDLWAAWPQSLFFGACFWAMAVVLRLVFRGSPEWTMTMVSGCFLVGPFLAMGLYDISRRRGAGLPQDLAASLTCWDRHLPSMGMLVLVLMVLELLWGRASLVVFAVFFYTGMPTTAGVLQAVFNPHNWQFVAVYALVGGIFAALVYSTCAVSIPMIMDRGLDAITAGLRSFQLVLSRPGVMLLWGLLIVALTLAALALPWAAGVLVVVPWLGHATWHGYRQVMPPAADAALA
ncbi:DUF2189 domain-containing protein [Pseudorhodoferax sp.]|uniref:DUF2189 domain-containing protein n=1 Tax=Pseudorhodoferax sp. TaxID=1993553 RepID=UPI0039E309F7